ncbi:MAG: hypothetical protein WD398_04470 [Cyclobacteriaceae bacterium]
MKSVFKLLIIVVGVFLTYQISRGIIKGFFIPDEKKTLSSDHFNVHFHGVSSWDAEKTANELENNYRRITEDLQAPAHPKVHVYIHPNKDDFQDIVGFDALGAIKGIDTLHLMYSGFPISWMMPMEEVAIHEFTHNVTLNLLVQDAISSGKISAIQDFDGLYSREGKRFEEVYPRWLWESIAVYEANQLNRFSLYMSLKDGFPNLSSTE